MNFADALRNESKLTKTENGAVALKTTSNALVDLFGCIGSLRSRTGADVERLFAEAYRVDPLLATKIAFYSRDIREGCGERKVFRTILRYLANYHAEAIKPNLDLIGVYGRYDDLYSLVGTPVEEDMWTAMKKQFDEDVENLKANKCVSLLAKWIKTPDASSANTKKLGCLTAKKLGYSVYDFKRTLRKLRRKIRVVESLMSAGKWDEIEYSNVPSRAMMIYRKAFNRHDETRYTAFIESAVNGDVEIKASTLYPYDIVEKFNPGSWRGCNLSYKEKKALEAQWRQLPNYVEEGTNAIVVADVSGSMTGRPMATSIGLAIYFAERNVGAYHNLFMTFSGSSTIQRVTGDTLEQKIAGLSKADWGMNTNLEKAFLNILHVAVSNKIPADEMVKSIIVISDMEIDSCASRNWVFYDTMREKYAKYGYEIPNVVFWNVNSRHDVFHADATRQGVQLCSGQSATTFKQLMGCVGMTPVEMMMKVINSERYAPITIG